MSPSLHLHPINVVVYNDPEKSNLVAGFDDEIHSLADEPFHIFGIIYCPGVNLHAKVVTFFDPLGMFFEDGEMVIRTGTTHVFQFLRIEVTFQIIYGSTFRSQANEFFGRMA